MGPLLGVAATLLWGQSSPLWHGFGALLGYCAEVVAERISAAERTEADRAIAFFFLFQTLLAVLPFLALSGVVPWTRAAEAGDLARLGLIPAAAALAAGWRYVRRRSHPPALHERRRRTASPAPDARRWIGISAAFALVLGVGWADYQLPAPYSLDLLYLLPIFVVAWTTGSWGAGVLAVFAAAVHGIARGLSYPGELSPAFASLESLIIAGGLAAEAVLLVTIRTGLDREKRAARTDLLTGLANRAHFLERVGEELARAGNGEPISLGYLDLDGFKAINDQRGHAAGDEVLRTVAGVLRTSLRNADVTARLGGDEFAVLMPATGSEGAASVMERVRREVEDRMLAFAWPVTCSVGVVTAVAERSSVEDLVRTADALMYEVKHGGKNALRHAILGER